MAQQRSAICDYAVYVAVRLLICVVQALSWSTSLALARSLAWVVWKVDRRHRQVAEDNLRHAFPDMGAAGIDRLTRATYRHLVTMVIEIIRLPRVLHRHNFKRYFWYANPGDYEKVLSVLKSGRPVLAVTGHFGNWEVYSYVIGLLGFRGSGVARKLDNPYLNDFVQRFREKTGQELLDKNEDYQRIENVLATGGWLGLLGDQDAGARGLFVDFLGRPASTFKSIALLSLTYSAPIIVFGVARIGEPMCYRLYIEDIILPEDYANHRQPALVITQRYSDGLARLVRRHPDQYFWLHRRWKHQPKAAKRRSEPPLSQSA